MTTATTCQHTTTIALRTRCWSGCLAGLHGECDEVAHGGVVTDLECQACGARRSEACNGAHGYETSGWSETRLQRQDDARARLAAARARLSLLTVAGDLGPVVVTIDRECMIVVQGLHQDERVVSTQIPASWLESAQAARAAYLDLIAEGVRS